MRRLSLSILAIFLLTAGAALAQGDDAAPSNSTQAQPSEPASPSNELAPEPYQQGSADPSPAVQSEPNAPAETTQTPTEPSGTLPQTASDLPLVAGLGLLTLAGAIVIRSSLKKGA